jgi:LuxR family maltose regulon positive regulatory protein
VLSVAYAQALLNAGQLEAAEARLLDAERWLTSERDQPDNPASQMVVVDEAQWLALPISLATVRAYHAQAIGNIPGALQYTQRVLDLLPEGDHPLRGPISMLLGLACWASGDLEAAYQNFSEGSAATDIQSRISAAFVLAEMKIELGHLQAAINICQNAIKLGDEHNASMLHGVEDVYSVLSNLHRERGDLEAAAQALVTSKELGENVLIPDWKYRWCIAKAQLKQTQGALDEALDLLDKATGLFVRTPLPDVHPIAAMKARVWVRQGRLAEARGWASEQGLSVDDELSFLREFDHITLTRVLIAHYMSNRGDDSICNAMGLAERLLQAAENGKRTGSVIEILILQAFAHEAQGDTPSALKPLEQALTLAEPEGYTHIFVDEGPPMASLLYEALKREIAPEYVQRLLAAFPVSDPEKAASTKSKVDQPGLIEPLSEREIDVLQFLAKGLTNQVIATRLFLSIHTVKTHTRNIYSKLGVNNRTQAVSKARALGIISDR